jgi:peptide chain release factor 1
MFDKLRQIEERYRELNRSLSDPAVLGPAGPLRAHGEGGRRSRRDGPKVRRLHGWCSPVSPRRVTSSTRTATARCGSWRRRRSTSCRPRQADLEQELRTLLVPRDPNDDKNVFLEIRAGAGGDEAGLFAADLARMYTKYAERQKWKVEVMDANPHRNRRPQGAVLLIQGRGAWSRLKFERGVHRVQRVPATESSGRIHTSTVTVAVFPRRRTWTSRSTTATCRWTCTGPRDRADRGSTRRTPPCASHTCPPDSW